MNKVLVCIGAALLSVLLFSVPILTTLSYVYNWNSFWSWLLTIFSVCEFFTIFASLLAEGENDR